jgi:hypothetical protein
MKVEMFCGNQIQGYLLDQNNLSVKINYGGVSFRIPERNYQTIEKLTKKMCEMYSLGKDVISTDEEERVYSLKIILEYCPEEFWICINHMGNLVKVELKRIKYEIIKKEYVHGFSALICNAWNYLALRKYICLLVGGESRLVEIYMNGNLWSEYDLAVNKAKVKTKALIRKKDDSKKFVRFWITDKKNLEIWSLNIRCNYYNKYLTVWSKMTLGYALEIWDECIPRPH